VDLWDLTKLLLRRWYVAVPLLLLSILGVVLAAQSVGPDYKAKGYVQIIPPQSAGRQEDPATKRTSNPWMDLGYQALANAALLQVTDQTTLEAIAAKGLSDSITVTLGERTQLLEIEAIGATPAQASQTVQEVVKLLVAAVVAQQQPYNLATQDTIRTRVLNDGSGTEVVTSKIKRVLIVAAAVGILLTAGLTIGFDSLWRRRAERRLLRAAAGSAGAVRSAAARRPAGMNGATGSSTYQATAAAPADAGGPTATRAADNDETQVFNIGMGGSAGSPRPVAGGPTRAEKAANGTRPTVDAVEFKEQARKPVPRVKPDPDATVVPEAKSVEGADSTIILPLSGASWAKRPPKKR
jgi:capsular polysaccharide biosynthesis protein